MNNTSEHRSVQEGQDVLETGISHSHRWHMHTTAKTMIVPVVAVALAVAAILLLLPTSNHKTERPYSLAVLLAPTQSPVTVAGGIVQKTYNSFSNGTKLRSLLLSMGVSLKVDGVKVPIGDIESRLLGFDYNDLGDAYENALKDGLNTAKAVAEVSSPTFALPQAIAVVGLDQLLLENARAKGLMVSMATAKKFAQNNYDMFSKLPPGRRPPVQKYGITLKQAILSPFAIAHYRNMLTENEMIALFTGYAKSPTQAISDAVAGEQPSRNGIPKNVTPILESWMQGQLKTHSVIVSGVPGIDATNITSHLPPDL